MHTEAASARAPEARPRGSIVPAMLGGIVLAYFVAGLALYELVSAIA
jgi:hypothetical protein